MEDNLFLIEENALCNMNLSCSDLISMEIKRQRSECCLEGNVNAALRSEEENFTRAGLLEFAVFYPVFTEQQTGCGELFI